jgi:hypothetical protein
MNFNNNFKNYNSCGNFKIFFFFSTTSLSIIFIYNTTYYLLTSKSYGDSGYPRKNRL